MKPARPDTWMPMFWGDYVRDTGHLNNAEHGSYLMLMKHYWCTGKPLTDNDAQLWRIACCDSLAQWKKMRATLETFFTVGNGLWVHKRIDREIETATQNVNKKSVSGKNGANKRWQTDSTRIVSPLAEDKETDSTRIVSPLANGKHSHHFANATSPSPIPKSKPESKNQSQKPPASAGPAPKQNGKTTNDPPESYAAQLWRDGKALLTASGMTEPAADAFLGKLKRDHGLGGLQNAIEEAKERSPADPKAYLHSLTQKKAQALREYEQQFVGGI